MKKMKPETKQKIIKISIVIFLLVAISLAIYLPLQLTGTLDRIDSAEKLKEEILKFGAYSYIIFFVIQFLQTTILPIPAAVTTIAGTLLFGPWITIGISFAAVFLGSLFAFFLGKKVGRKTVVWIAGEKTTEKWEEKLKQGKYVFFLMMLFPLFPDDILCIVAGTINMSYRFFIITNLITRPIAIVSTCFLSSGQIIPFSGWGYAVWAVLIVLIILALVLSFKFQPQIEKFVVNLGHKITGKNKKNKQENENIENTDTSNNTENTEQNKEQIEVNSNAPNESNNNQIDKSSNENKIEEEIELSNDKATDKVSVEELNNEESSKTDSTSIEENEKINKKEDKNN